MSITLYHCADARSLRPLWCLEEMQLDYELINLPFPPRVFAKEYKEINPLGTIPFLIDGETRMTESSGICHYLTEKYGPTDLALSVTDPDYGSFLNWLYFSDRHIDLPANAGASLHNPRTEGATPPASGRRLCGLVLWTVAACRERVRRPHLFGR